MRASESLGTVVAAAFVDGLAAGGVGIVAPFLFSEGGFTGDAADHPADGEYVFRLRYPVPARTIKCTITPLGDGTQNIQVRFDTSNVNHPTAPTLTVYLSTP